MSQPTVQKVEDEPKAEAKAEAKAEPEAKEEEQVEEEVQKVEETVSKQATVNKPHVAQTTKKSLTHNGPVTGIRYVFPSSRGRSKDNLRWIAIHPDDADRYKFMAKKNHDWHFENRAVPQTREAHFVTYNGTEGSSVDTIDFPMFDHDKRDPDKRKRVYHFVKGETLEVAEEDADRFEAKASGTKAWTYVSKTVPVEGGS